MFYKNKEVDHHTPGGSKQGIGMAGINRYEDMTISSSSTYLPPLMDDSPLLLPPPYNEYQTYHHHDQSLYEQVPCFSIFNPMNIISSKFTTTNSSIPNTNTNTNTFGDQLINGTTCCEDKMVIDAVLNHLTKMDNNNINIISHTDNNMMMIKDSPCSFGEAASTSESFLSEVETIWNNY